MKIYSKDDYEFLVRNGCYPDGYVEGLGIVGSQTVSVMSTAPVYPNTKALGIDRRTQFLSTIKVPVVTPLVVPEVKKVTHEELTSVLKKIIDENTLMPSFSPDLRAMVYKLKEEIAKMRAKNYETIQKEKAKLEKDPTNKSAQKKIKKAEEENEELENVEREIRILATSTQQYDMVTNYPLPVANEKTDYKGFFAYNDKTEHAELRFTAQKPTLGVFAHELKHAYQFETGTLSSPSYKSTFFLYDKEDEREAFRRGQLFKENKTFAESASGYQEIPDSREFNDFIKHSESLIKHSWIDSGVNYETKVITPEVLHRFEIVLKDPRTTQGERAEIENKIRILSEESHVAFRVNGKTYYTPPTR